VPLTGTPLADFTCCPCCEDAPFSCRASAQRAPSVMRRRSADSDRDAGLRAQFDDAVGNNQRDATLKPPRRHRSLCFSAFLSLRRVELFRSFIFTPRVLHPTICRLCSRVHALTPSAERKKKMLSAFRRRFAIMPAYYVHCRASHPSAERFRISMFAISPPAIIAAFADLPSRPTLQMFSLMIGYKYAMSDAFDSARLFTPAEVRFRHTSSRTQQRAHALPCAPSYGRAVTRQSPSFALTPAFTRWRVNADMLRPLNRRGAAPSFAGRGCRHTHSAPCTRCWL